MVCPDEIALQTILPATSPHCGTGSITLIRAIRAAPTPCRFKPPLMQPPAVPPLTPERGSQHTCLLSMSSRSDGLIDLLDSPKPQR